MSIPISCTCGRRFRIKDELAGKRIRCPECQAILSVPEVEEEPVEVAASASESEPEADEPVVRRPTPPARPAPPRKKKKRPWDEVEPRRSSSSTDEGWFGRTNAGVLGGLLMIVIAIVWFVLGLVLIDRIFFYPPILLVIGVIAIGKGLAGKS